LLYQFAQVDNIIYFIFTASRSLLRTEEAMKNYALILGLTMLVSAPCFADEMPVNPDGVTWGPAPPMLQKGAQLAVLSGDPSKDGLYVVRLKMPANFRIAARHHPTTEYVTVLSGKFNIGMGDKLDEKRASNSRRAASPQRRRA
jgi:hypothetical protein